MKFNVQKYKDVFGPQAKRGPVQVPPKEKLTYNSINHSPQIADNPKIKQAIVQKNQKIVIQAGTTNDLQINRMANLNRPQGAKSSMLN